MWVARSQPYRRVAKLDPRNARMMFWLDSEAIANEDFAILCQ